MYLDPGFFASPQIQPGPYPIRLARETQFGSRVGSRDLQKNPDSNTCLNPIEYGLGWVQKLVKKLGLKYMFRSGWIWVDLQISSDSGNSVET